MSKQTRHQFFEDWLLAMAATLSAASTFRIGIDTLDWYILGSTKVTGFGDPEAKDNAPIFSELSGMTTPKPSAGWLIVLAVFCLFSMSNRRVLGGVQLRRAMLEAAYALPRKFSGILS